MTYGFTNNYTPATGANAMFDAGARFILQGATKTQDSDGTTRSSSGAQVTGGNTGAHGLQNTDAYEVFSLPAGQQVLWQRGTTNLVWRMKFSQSAGFSGGSPSATQVPSATDEVIIFGGGTDAAPTFSAFFAADGGYRWNVGMDNAAPYAMWMSSFTVGGSAPLNAFAFEPLTQLETGDVNTVGLHCNGTGANALKLGGLNLETAVANATGFLATTPKASPAASADWFPFPAMEYVSTGAAAVCPGGAATSSLTLKDPGIPITFWRRAAISNPNYKGIGTQMRWLSVARATPQAVTASTTNDRIALGDASLPWDGSGVVL